MKPPRIDKRRFSDHLDLLHRAPIEVGGTVYRGLSRRFVPEWTAAAQATPDVGVVMGRLFARLMDTLVERLNRVPEKHFTAFLNMVGIERLPGSPARVPVTFTPAPKSPPGRHVPAGTQVATTQTDEVGAITFETEEGFDLTPVTLDHAFSVDPAADRYLKLGLDDVAAVILQSSAADLAVEHSLYLAHDGLFSLGTEPVLTVRLRLARAASVPGMTVVWERFDGDGWIPIEGVAEGTGWLGVTGDAEVTMAAFSGSEPTVVGDREAHWIRARATGVTGDEAGLPVVEQITVAARPPAGRRLLPDAAFINTLPIDLNLDFHPFGPKPAGNDAFYLASDEALKPTDPPLARDVTLELRLAPSPGQATGSEFPNTADGAVVTWEYWSLDDASWRPIDPITDGSANFTTQSLAADPDAVVSIVFTLPGDIGAVAVNGVEAHWIRARLSAGDYGTEAQSSLVVEHDEITSYTFTPASFRPPFFSLEKFRIGYQIAPAEAFVALTACKSVNHFRLGDHLAVSQVPGSTFQPFRTLAQLAETSPALYLGYSGSFGNFRISQLLSLEPPDPRKLAAEEGSLSPRIVWEYTGELGSWQRLDARDGSRELSDTGTLAFTAPPDMAASRQFGHDRHWLRARLAAGVLRAPRRLRAVHLNTVLARSLRTVRGELLGSGTAEAPQTVRLSQAPVLLGESILVRENNLPSDQAIAELEAQEAARARRLDREPRPVIVRRGDELAGSEEIWVRWYPVNSFRFSSPTGRHYVIDRVTGEATFGALASEPGFEAMPVPVGRDNIRAEDYQAHDGAGAELAGMVDSVKELKSSLPFVAEVSNQLAAAGGSAAETVADALERGPSTLKHRNRAVTIEDFDALALEASTRVALVRTLPVTDPNGERELGAVSVMIVPFSTERRPMPGPELLAQVRDYLTRRASETAAHRIYVVGPTYVEARVSARIVALDPAAASLVTARVAQALESFFHPLTGGRDGAGWSFGRNVYISEVYARIEATAGVDFVVEASFAAGDPAEVAVGVNELVASGSHEVEAVTTGTVG